MINNSQRDKKDALLPPPEIIERYQELNLGEDLIELVQKEQEHRHGLQKKYLISFRIGQMFSLVLWGWLICKITNLIKLGFRNEAYVILGVFTALSIITPLLSNRSVAKSSATNTRPSGRRPNGTRSRSYNSGR